MNQKTINIGNDFSKFPAGRYPSDGEFNGEKFREKILKKALSDINLKKIIIDLDGTAGYGSSFLEEAFGGLVRVEGFTKEILHEKVELKASDQSLINEVWKYIDKA